MRTKFILTVITALFVAASTGAALLQSAEPPQPTPQRCVPIAVIEAAFISEMKALLKKDTTSEAVRIRCEMNLLRICQQRAEMRKQYSLTENSWGFSETTKKSGAPKN